MPKLRLGCIDYVNSLAFTRELKTRPVPGVECVFGAPGELNRMFRAGELDVSAVSSYEALSNPEAEILPGLCIQSSGSVRSVLLFSKCPVERLGDGRVAVSSESATSAALLRIWLGRLGVCPAEYLPLEEKAEADAKLLIGDKALSWKDERFPYRYDLAEEWTRMTGMPVVFALWVVRKGLGKEYGAAMRELLARFDAAKEAHHSDPESLVNYAKTEGCDRDFPEELNLLEYFRGLDFSLNEDARAFLEDFAGRLSAEFPGGSFRLPETWKDGHGERVRKMFDEVARRYNLLNTVLTVGMDASWRKLVRRTIVEARPKGGVCLDVGCGSGVVSGEPVPNFRSVGLDFSREMLKVSKKAYPELPLVQADAQRLPFRDESMDAVTGAFVFRNLADLGAGISEAFRVLRPGGILLSLEFSMPSNFLFRRLYAFHLRYLLPLTACVFGGDFSAYRYLGRSILVFGDRVRMDAEFSRAGFKVEQYRPLLMGGVRLTLGRKPEKTEAGREEPSV